MEDNQLQKYDYRVFCDMDGVIADFEKHFLELFGKNPETTPNEELWPLIESYGKAKFFSELPWTTGGEGMWGFIVQNFLTTKILSASGKSDAADKQVSTGKRMWLRHNIPSLREDDIIFVPNKHKKRHYCKGPSDIIIDDTVVVIQEWVKKGGIGIPHHSANETITKLKEYV